MTMIIDHFSNFANALRNATSMSEQTLQLEFTITWENLLKHLPYLHMFWNVISFKWLL
jgi:hypothetical protein